MAMTTTFFYTQINQAEKKFARAKCFFPFVSVYQVDTFIYFHGYFVLVTKSRIFVSNQIARFNHYGNSID